MTILGRRRCDSWRQLALRAMELVESKQERIETLQESNALLRQGLDLSEREAEVWRDLAENPEHALELLRLRRDDPHDYLGLEEK